MANYTDILGIKRSFKAPNEAIPKDRGATPITLLQLASRLWFKGFLVRLNLLPQHLKEHSPHQQHV